MAPKAKNYPNLDGIGLPPALTGGVRKAFDLIYALRDGIKPSPSLLSGTHVQRISNFPAGTYLLNSTFFETDRTSMYQVLSVGFTNTWVWVGGEMQDTSSTLANLPTDLSTNDKGFKYRNTFFYRTWEWSGSAWHYATGEVGAGTQVATSGGAPSGGLWQACDGSSVSCALDNATVSSLTASDTRAVGGNNPMIEGGPGGSPQAPIRATWDPSAVTDDESAHTHAVGQGVIVQGSGANATVDVSTPTGAGSAHHHVLSNTNAKLTLFGETNGGLPQRVSMAWFMRR